MRAVPESIVGRFAREFCFGGSGYSLRELADLFPKYQADVPAPDSKMAPTKGSYFQQALAAMTPLSQRQCLYDLCDDPAPATGPLPSQDARLQLLSLLAAADGISPLGTGLSRCTIRAVRTQWFTAASRLNASPSSAVTAARALLESTCATILVERQEAPDTSGDLGRLFGQTRKSLDLVGDKGTDQAIHQVYSGLVQVVNGMAGLSNQVGDRHGLEDGLRIDDHAGASLAVHASGTIALFLVNRHKLSWRASSPA
jgi:Abortive infection C-terminus